MAKNIMSRWTGLALSVALMVPGAAAGACPLATGSGAFMAKGRTLAISAAPEGGPIKTGAPFSLLMTICGEGGKPFGGRLKPDATMPMHKHGMNYKPSVTSLGEGRYRADGFVFHMPGHWQFVFELNDGERTERIRIDHHVK